MKFLVCIVAFLAVTAASETENTPETEKRVAKRGIYGGGLGLGYGGIGLGYGGGIGLGYGGGIGYGGAVLSAPIIRAAPVIAAPVIAAPIVRAAPIISAPIVHAPIVRSYAAPIRIYSSYGQGYGLGRRSYGGWW